MNRASMVFCMFVLLASAIASVIGYFFAALPREIVAAARTPTPAERMGSIDLGHGFGTVSVLDLVGYYLENPPIPSSPSAAPAKARRFGGC